ncbi:hypothetical protein pb186bvf_009808 [Paramecium bursaria]
MIILQIQVDKVETNSSEILQLIENGLMITMWTFTSFLLFFGLIGVIGSLKKIKCLLFVYNITNFIGFVAFLVLGAVALAAGTKISNLDTKSNCLSLSWSEKLTNTYNWSGTEFCQQDCQCYISSPILAQTYGVPNYTTTPSNVISVQECPGIDILLYENQASFLNFAERNFDCAGWCVGQKYYSFSDINQPVPASGKNGCYSKSIQWFANIPNTLGDVCMGIMSVLGIFMLFTCCLCFHKDKPPGNLYARMSNYDQQS